MNKSSALIGNINGTRGNLHVSTSLCAPSLSLSVSLYLALTHSPIEARAALAHVNHVVVTQASNEELLLHL